MPPHVSIIIVNYNNWEDTIECLDSLKNLSYKNFDVILIDNGSSEPQPKNFRISDYNYPLRFIPLNQNLGFAGGNNLGIKQALKSDANYILFLNNDTIVEPNFLNHLVEVGESDKSIGIIGPLIYKYTKPLTDFNQIWFAGGKIKFLPPKAEHLFKLAPLSYSPQISDYISGCCLLIKREVINKIGLIPEIYFLYYEDVEWCLLAKKQGFKIVLAPSAIIYHKQSKSAKEGSFLYIYYHTRNALLFVKNNGGVIIKISIYLYSFWLFLKQILKLILIPSKRHWAKAIIKGILDFWRNKYGKLEIL